MVFPDRIARTVEIAHPPAVEAGFAQLPHDAHAKAHDGNTEGWAKELAELVSYLDAA